jgi:hypothetical protein
LVGELRFVAQATAVVASLLMVGTANAALINGTSGNSPAGDDPPIIVGADWFTTPIDPPAFYWGSGAGAPNTEGGFTFNALGPVRVDVTDDFGHGDQFQVFDFGASLGVTSAVPNLNDGGNGGEGPVAAFADPTYSHGSFFLGAGAHSITIDTIVNPYDGGRGYLRVLGVPEPSTLAMVCFAVVGIASYCRSRWKKGIKTIGQAI